jgi:hypothetical protein
MASHPSTANNSDDLYSKLTVVFKAPEVKKAAMLHGSRGLLSSFLLKVALHLPLVDRCYPP